MILIIATTCIASVAWPLSEIINCSFKTGIVPNALKIAKVGPIFKKEERDNITDYRPISILPYFQGRQSGLKTGGLWIRVKKISIFSGNLTKIIDFSGQISETFRFFNANF